MKESELGQVEIPNVEYGVFVKLLEFLYTDSLRTDANMAIELIAIAHEVPSHS